MKKFIKFTTIIITMIILSLNLYACAFSPISAVIENKSILINEICAKNTTFPDENGNYFDWIELYNNSNAPIDIGGCGLSEKEKKPFKYIIPNKTIIQPKSYLVIYCDKYYSQKDPNIACFSLSTEGETVYLTSPNSTEIDKLEYKSINRNESYGRFPDGSENFSMLSMSPEKTNHEADIEIKPPVFSHEGGFYDNEFELTLSADKDCQIYYTLDGSDPTTESCLYTNPIHIYDKTIDDNVLSNRTDISAFEEYIIPNKKIDKATVIKAMSINTKGIQSEISANTYFVDYSNKADYYKKWKIISIITDNDNLFGEENGIYILGKTHTDWINSDAFTPESLKQFWPSNYTQKGIEWEREATFQIIENNKTQLSQNVGIRIHGGASRSWNQKSFNVYARSEYGKKKIKYDFFSDGNQKYDSIILRNGGNDRLGHFRDKLSQYLVRDRDFLTQNMEPCIVFINGEYWGKYEITEKISSDFINKYTKIKEKDLFLIKSNEMYEGNIDDYIEYKELEKWIKITDFSNNDNYNKLCGIINMQGYIDYICSNIYLANSDWLPKNTSWYKDKSNDNKYEFIMFDVDYAAQDDVNINIFKSFYGIDNFISYIYRNSINNSQFKKQFYNTFIDIANNNFNSNNVNQEIDKISRNYKESVLDTYNRFYSQIYNLSTYNDNIIARKKFFNERFDIVTQQLKDELKLEGKLVNVTLENNNNNGTITLNTITPKMNENDSWNGKYFTDYPINISAEPNDGYEFSHFELSDRQQIFSPSAEINLEEDIIIKAVYEKKAIKGDISGNSLIDIYDAIEIAKFLAGKKQFTENEMSVADFNGDGTINLYDAIAIAEHILKSK